MGLTIQDPEDEDSKLYFVLVTIDVSNISQLRKITSLECSGGVSPEILAAFTEQGGVLDPKVSKLAELGGGPGMTKAMEFMNKGGSGKAPKRGKRQSTGGSENPDANQGAATEAIGGLVILSSYLVWEGFRPANS